MSNPADNPIWHEIGNSLKPLLRLADGTMGVFLIERNDAIAALIVGSEKTQDPEHMEKVLRMFQERLGDMADKANSGILDLEKGNQSFVRDSVTGEYNEASDEDSFQN